jgi:hypothetical protein
VRAEIRPPCCLEERLCKHGSLESGLMSHHVESSKAVCGFQVLLLCACAVVRPNLGTGGAWKSWHIAVKRRHRPLCMQ